MIEDQFLAAIEQAKIIDWQFELNDLPCWKAIKDSKTYIRRLWLLGSIQDANFEIKRRLLPLSGSNFVEILVGAKAAWVARYASLYSWEKLIDPKIFNNTFIAPDAFPHPHIRIENGRCRWLVKNTPEAIDNALNRASNMFRKPTGFSYLKPTPIPRAPKELNISKIVEFHKAEIAHLEKKISKTWGEYRAIAKEELDCAKENLKDAEAL